ncbi:hypothetical protein NX035_20970, partial [Escherichia coli]|nr:hypothetical protein [Escherichia coli]
ILAFDNHTNGPLTDLRGKAHIFSHPVYLSLKEFSLQDSRGDSPLAGVVPATVSRINAEITFAPELTGASYVINCARARDMEFED